MDAYQQQQQHHRNMRPPQPPPSTSEPYQYQYLHQQRPPVPQQGTWYSNQFQFHQSPSPPPPYHWGPPPPAAPASPYPPPSHPYPSHLHPQNHHFPPPSHAPSPATQAYAPEWSNPNLGQHQPWNYSAHNNAEDWAAKARAWAAAKQVAAEDQHPPPPQFIPGSRPEEQTQYYNQYAPAMDHYQDVQQHAFPVFRNQQFLASDSAPQYQAPMAYIQETAPPVSSQSSYVLEGHLQGSSVGAPTLGSSVHQQEVPSSYSSVTGEAKTADQNEQLPKSLSLPVSQAQEGQHHMQPSLSASALAEEPFAYANHAVDRIPDLSDQPLDFAPGFRNNHAPHTQSSYTVSHDSAGTIGGIGPSASVPSINSWTSVTSGAVYPQTSSVFSSVPQHDPSVAVPSTVSGHASSAFGSFPGSNFQPAVPSSGTTYGYGPGPALHPNAGFPGDTYGVSNVSERPKKGSVPNWLKEEIIKKASVMTQPSLEHTQEETESFDDEGVDKSIGKSDLTDRNSINSSRSTEEEEDDEDYAEAARASAINQEIKRILTEVLLKVTDELFDEIATKVLDEDNLTIEDENYTLSSNHEVHPFPSASLIPEASAKILVPVKARESETDHVNEEFSSSSPGNVLGLANYASDEDDDEIPSDDFSKSRKNAELQQSSNVTISEGMDDTAENGLSKPESANHSKEASLEGNVRKINSILPKKGTPGDAVVESETLGESINMKNLVAGDFEERETLWKSNQDNQHRAHTADEFVKEAESMSRKDERVNDIHLREDEKLQKKGKIDDRNGSKGRKNERADEMGEKSKEADSHERNSSLDTKKLRKEAEDQSSIKEDNIRKRERAKDKNEDRGRHKLYGDSSKHKRRRSSSIGSQGRNSKDNDSNDEASHYSKRKQHSRNQQSSPSPVRSRRRQVSRSPHSKHSQRRHSPYSSIESGRRKLRSKSPVRRRR